MLGLDTFSLIVVVVLAAIVIHILGGLRSYRINCPNCKFEGRARKKAGGSFLVEIVLWLLLIVPGLIYSLWRMTSTKLACPKCGYPHVVRVK